MEKSRLPITRVDLFYLIEWIGEAMTFVVYTETKRRYSSTTTMDATNQLEFVDATQAKEKSDNDSHVLLPIPEGFTKPLKTQSVRWTNFYRSVDKRTGNCYDAKCGFCSCDVDGRPERLHNHVLKCTSWPVLERARYLQCASKENSEAEPVQRKRQREVEVAAQSSCRQQSMLSWVSKPMSSQKTNDIHGFLLKSIIYGGISFTIGENMFFNQFAQALSSSYRVPSRKTLGGRVLTEMFSKHVQKKLAYFPKFKDFTICFDGWTDVSGNSIYAFMVLKEESEDVVDIVDLSDVRHTAINLKDQLISKLLMNAVEVDNAVACVTDSPKTMVRLRNDLRLSNPNILSIRCCLHGFNLLAKDVVGFPQVASVCKLNQKLVNYFTSSHIWQKALKKWQEEKKIPHFLSTFCETRWYSLARVCLGVASYEEGFKYCLELAKKPEYPNITNTEVRSIIANRYHFANNDCLVLALKPIVDVIGKLEKRTTTLADVLESFIVLYHIARKTDYAIPGLKEHILCAIGKRVKEFEDPIYFVALFLHPTNKKMAMSRKMSSEIIIKEALTIAKAWGYGKREGSLLYRELINYKNGDAPFDDMKESTIRSARDFWENFGGASPLLRRLATKVFAIVPHSGSCERLFSTLGLIKTKPRNRLDVDTLNMMAQIKCELEREIGPKKKKLENGGASDPLAKGLSMGDFEESFEDDMESDILEEVIEEVHFSTEDLATQIMEDFFDFDAFELDNVLRTSEAEATVQNASTSQGDGEWSIDDIINECS